MAITAQDVKYAFWTGLLLGVATLFIRVIVKEPSPLPAEIKRK